MLASFIRRLRLLVPHEGGHYRRRYGIQDIAATRKTVAKQPGNSSVNEG
jgi:hypothetical protein